MRNSAADRSAQADLGMLDSMPYPCDDMHAYFLSRAQVAGLAVEERPAPGTRSSAVVLHTVCLRAFIAQSVYSCACKLVSCNHHTS